MEKEEIVKALKELYQKALNYNDISLCLEIIQEIIDVKQMKEFTYEIE